MPVRICTHLFVTILLGTWTRSYSLDDTLKVEKTEGSRVENTKLAGHRVNFSWIRSNEIENYLEAASRCEALNAQLPPANEMRYFYKTIRSDDAILPQPSSISRNENQSIHGVSFYLADVLEATMDYPNSASGERMCLVVEKRVNYPVHLAEVTAMRSCSMKVNLLVCRSTIENRSSNTDDDRIAAYKSSMNLYSVPQPEWVLELKRKMEYRSHHICLKPEVFYSATISGGIVLFFTSALSIVFAVRYSKLIRVSKRASKPQGEEYLLASSGNEALQPMDGLSINNTGKLDILADSAFYQVPGSGFSNRSYKQMLVGDGYHKLTNGMQSDRRMSRSSQTRSAPIGSPNRVSTRQH